MIEEEAVVAPLLYQTGSVAVYTQYNRKNTRIARRWAELPSNNVWQTANYVTTASDGAGSVMLMRSEAMARVSVLITD